MNPFYRKVGAYFNGNDKTDFVVWAPLKNKVEVLLKGEEDKLYPLQKDDRGYWVGSFEGIKPGDRYFYKIDNELDRPDPASMFQPDGVHGPSGVINRSFNWTDQNWKGLEMQDLIIYELHVGTFTQNGTFEGVIEKLDYLSALGITAIEIMPVGQFPGERNWGYDGVYPYAVQNSYGGPEGLKKLVDAAHKAGIAVILDVVYNHLGPDGNYLREFGPYFTDKYKTPWGDALNYDGQYCDGVRNFFHQNALMWLEEFHVDGLRMDAVHAIWDFSALHFMQELKEAVQKLEQKLGRKKVLIAELDLNNVRYINPVEKGGYGLDGQWIDEFHHALHSVLTGETDGYYEDFGKMDHLKRAFKDTYVYNGVFSPHRKKIFGTTLTDNPYSQFVVFAQNHDHIGNRPLGDRLTQTLSFEQLKLAAATYILSPYVPLLFMGEEYGEKNPFLYFVDHNEELSKLVSEGRKKEFGYFKFKDEFPDPSTKASFEKSVLSWNLEENSPLLNFYNALIALRKTHPAYKSSERGSLQLVETQQDELIALEKSSDEAKLLIVLNFSKEPGIFGPLSGDSKIIFHSEDEKWGGKVKGTALTNTDRITVNGYSVVVYEIPGAQGTLF